MEAAVDAMGLLGADAVVVAVPHGARDSLERIAERADQMVVLSVPEPYMAVGYWYLDFPQVSDAEVMGLLARARQESSSQG
jgi:predicted phosphoribosyltransferase